MYRVKSLVDGDDVVSRASSGAAANKKRTIR